MQPAACCFPAAIHAAQRLPLPPLLRAPCCSAPYSSSSVCRLLGRAGARHAGRCGAGRDDRLAVPPAQVAGLRGEGQQSNCLLPAACCWLLKSCQEVGAAARCWPAAEPTLACPACPSPPLLQLRGDGDSRHRLPVGLHLHPHQAGRHLEPASLPVLDHQSLCELCEGEELAALSGWSAAVGMCCAGNPAATGRCVPQVRSLPLGRPFCRCLGTPSAAFASRLCLSRGSSRRKGTR